MRKLWKQLKMMWKFRNFNENDPIPVSYSLIAADALIRGGWVDDLGPYTRGHVAAEIRKSLPTAIGKFPDFVTVGDAIRGFPHAPWCPCGNCSEADRKSMCNPIIDHEKTMREIEALLVAVNVPNVPEFVAALYSLIKTPTRQGCLELRKSTIAMVGSEALCRATDFKVGHIVEHPRGWPYFQERGE